jgi:RND family efflux transporter MFP subunit
LNVRAAIFFASALTLGVASGCARKPAEAQKQNNPPKAVRVVTTEQIGVEKTVYGTGTLAAQDRAVLSAKVPGRVEAVLVDLGTTVRKGDPLARIQKREFELKRQQAEAALWQARARLGITLTGEEDQVEPDSASLVKEAKAVLAEATKNRDRLLLLREQGIIPDADVEAAEAQYQVALNRHEESRHEARNRLAILQMRKAELQLADQELKDTELRAPFDGVVEQRQTSAGEFLSVGTPIMTVVRIDPIRCRLEISERDAPKVQLGQKVYVGIEGLDRQLIGQITRLSPVISAGNRMLLAEADLPNPSGVLRPGSFAKANVVVETNAPGIFIPTSAVVNFAGMQKVFVVEGGKAVEKEVKIGGKRAGRDDVEVATGLRAGELIVAEPAGLRNGQAVQTGHES